MKFKRRRKTSYRNAHNHDMTAIQSANGFIAVIICKANLLLTASYMHGTRLKVKL